ncbi:Alpha/Beta hydrolase protein [Phycomyces nitens]|nr:Alpha/Beta hydrolase protein [Phycomyces nitens]
MASNVLGHYNTTLEAFVQAPAHPQYPQHTLHFSKREEALFCDPTVKQINGYLSTASTKHFFFWFFESRGNPEKDPLILWLNGGPGCSSMTGLFMELGPCLVDKKGQDVHFNRHSWNKHANILFLDQPISSGFSYGQSSVSDSGSAIEEVYAFLQMFFSQFNGKYLEYAPLDFHIADAGHYIPPLATLINKENRKITDFANLFHRKMKPDSVVIQLKSIAIGNGMADPLTQYKSFSEMACKNSYGPVLTKTACRKMDDAYPRCARLIQRCYDDKDAYYCEEATTTCNEIMLVPFMNTGRSVYDVRKECKGGPLCYDHMYAVERYLRKPSVIKAAHSEITNFKTCNSAVNHRFVVNGDWMKPYHASVPRLLDEGIRVLLYAGDADYICNWIGYKDWANSITWSQQMEFKRAHDLPWVSKTTGRIAGEIRQTRNGRLTFLKMFKAGHMVPYDQPEHALDMIHAWTQGNLGHRL